MAGLEALLRTHYPDLAVGEDEITILAETAVRCEYEQGYLLFDLHSPRDTIYLLKSGSIDLFARLEDQLEQTLLTVRPGGFIGLTHLVGETVDDVAARVAESCVLYAFEHQKINDLIEKHQGLGNKLLRCFMATIAQRRRLLTDTLRQNIMWTMQVSGLAGLDISRLIIDRAEIEIELVNGKQLKGVIMKAETHDSGFELFVAVPDGRIYFIPYHAIVSAALPKGATPSTMDDEGR
ncbi:MAG: Crp/Fnr family transcriptional regulator [Desulfofustis sp. PB-SRB1]|jgi:CRP-like cAMP-binding protein|nr:Crp/Fnr family transcriptional regulator [Desulfofustis sp. PB-SRB1]MBM1000975.1 Crp/Fnr family transcriptional regulator [Desulfofustis sp. PB-SRB1]HBH31881.1 Crp/Fnr family transcriptional regulator [Desulfofustis sp.]